MGQEELRRLLDRYVDFDAIPAMIDENDPALLTSAINVLSGEFQIFRESEIWADAMLASSAEPHLFEAVEHGNRYYFIKAIAHGPLCHGEVLGHIRRREVTRIVLEQVDDPPIDIIELFGSNGKESYIHRQNCCLMLIQIVDSWPKTK